MSTTDRTVTVTLSAEEHPIQCDSCGIETVPKPTAIHNHRSYTAKNEPIDTPEVNGARFPDGWLTIRMTMQPQRRVPSETHVCPQCVAKVPGALDPTGLMRKLLPALFETSR